MAKSLAVRPGRAVVLLCLVSYLRWRARSVESVLQLLLGTVADRLMVQRQVVRLEARIEVLQTTVVQPDNLAGHILRI